MERNPEKLHMDLQNLRRELIEQGWFKASALYYSCLIVGVLLLPTAGLFFLKSNSWVGWSIATVCFAFFYPHMAYLGHDFAHGQVFYGKFRSWNAVFGNYIFGCLLQGFCYSWWQAKHSAHHQNPNSYQRKGEQIDILDHDLRTNPLIIWNAKLVPPQQLSAFESWARLQRFYFPLLLSLARVSWALQNIYISFQKKNYLETLLIFVHYILFFSILLVFVDLTLPQAMLFWFLANIAGGALLAWIFILNHSGKEVIDVDREINFFDSQVRTTRNVTANTWMNWLTGGLNLQLEHHLFPSLPRHRLHRITPRIQEILKKNGYEYESLGFFKATKIAFFSLPNKLEYF